MIENISVIILKGRLNKRRHLSTLIFEESPLKDNLSLVGSILMNIFFQIA